MKTTSNPMKVKSIGLMWIVVSNFKNALKFYTETMGLQVKELNEQYQWAELSGSEDELRLGIAGPGDHSPIKAGQNAVFTLSVENLDQSIKHLKQSGVRLIGSVQEVPGEVKMQTAVDHDGNYFQLAELLK